jgi:hypothetical protein
MKEYGVTNHAPASSPSTSMPLSVVTTKAAPPAIAQNAFDELPDSGPRLT